MIEMINIKKGAIYIMRICITGCGGIAHGVHLPSVVRYQNLHGGLEISACADINPENLNSLAAKYSIPLKYENYRQMLNEQNPDAVICLVKENVIAEISSDILLMGYPVLFEKPPGKTKAEVLLIADAAKKSGKPHMVAFNRRHMPAMTKLKEIAADRKITHIAYDFYRKRRYDHDFSDTAIHAVDTVKFLAGSDYKSVEIFYDEMPHKGKNVANYYLCAKFESQATAFIRILVDTGEVRERAEVHVDGDIIIANAAFANNPADTGGVRVISDSKITYDISGEELTGCDLDYVLGGFYHEHEYFYGCLKNNVKPKHDVSTAIQSVEICEAIRNRVASVKF